MSKICYFSSSRADYGIAKILCKTLEKIYKKNFFILATGSHLSKKNGYTINEIRKDKFKNLKILKFPIFNNTAKDIAFNSVVLMKKISIFFEKNKLKYIILLGDRYEVFICAYVANLFNIKIIHISGGDSTFGSKDDIYRHSISLMSQFSIVTNIISQIKLISLGIKKKTIFNLGNLNLENYKKKFLSKKDLQNKYKIKFNKINFLITFHPETENKNITESYLKNCINIFRSIKNASFIFTSSNFDMGGNNINQIINKYVKKNSNIAYFIKSFGREAYFSLLQNIDLVIGNSSSAICEVPSFKIGSLNIGKRQDGRIFAKSVINSDGSEKDIRKKIKYMLSKNFKNKIKKQNNVYFKKNPLNKYISVLKKIIK